MQYFGLVPAHPNHRASDARTRRRMRDLVVLNVTTETVHMVLYDVFDYFGYTVTIMSVDTYTHIYVYNVYIYIYILLYLYICTKNICLFDSLPEMLQNYQPQRSFAPLEA